MKTRIVKFSFSTVKDAALEIPAEPASIYDTVRLIRKSYLNHAFRPGCGLMSDEVLTSSIGKANFFAGALGGFETRVDIETFRLLKDYLNDDAAMALEVVRFRNPLISDKDAYESASKNEALSQDTREFLSKMAELKKAILN